MILPNTECAKFLILILEIQQDKFEPDMDSQEEGKCKEHLLVIIYRNMLTKSQWLL